MGKSFRYQNLTGGLNLVSSIGTINQTPRRTESPDMVNVEYFKLGGIKSMEGNLQIGNTLEHPVVGGWEYTQGNNKWLMCGTQDGSVYWYNQAASHWDLVYKFPSSSWRMSFCNMNDGVVVTNGEDDPIYWLRGRHTLMTGQLTGVTGSTAITGSQTLFTKELVVGQQIEVDGKTYTITKITDDTHLTVAETIEEGFTDQQFYLGALSLCNAYLVNEDDPQVKTPIRGLAIQYFKGRLWIGSGSTFYYSELGFPNKWDIKYGAGGIGDFYNDTSNVVALGLFSNYMLIHKEYYTYVLSGGDDPNSWVVEPYSSVSCDSQQSWCQTNSKYFVFSRENMGIYPLTQVTVFSDKYIGNEISVKIRDVFKELRMEDLDQIFTVAHPSKRWLMFYMPFEGYAGSARCFIFDFQTQSWLQRIVPQDVTIAFEYSNRVYIGTRDGKVLREFYGKTFDGEFLDAYWKSPWFSFGDDTYYKTFEEFAIQLAEDENNNFYIRSYRDGESKFKQRSLSNNQSDTNALIWAGIEQDVEINVDNYTSWDNNDWVKAGIVQLRMPLELNMFYNYQIELRTATLNQGFSTYGFSFRRVEYDEAPW